MLMGRQWVALEIATLVSGAVIHMDIQTTVQEACEEIKRLADLASKLTDERQRRKVFQQIWSMCFFLWAE